MNVRHAASTLGIVVSLGLVLCATSVSAQEGNVAAAAPPTASDARDLEERIILRFGLSYDQVSTSLSGDPDLQNNTLSDDQLRTQVQSIRSDLALGTRSLLLPTLNTYVLGTAYFDINDQPGINAFEDRLSDDSPVHPSVYNSYDGGNALLVHSAYGELEGFGSSGALGNMFLRAGRQYYWSVASVTFDGGTIGYDDGSLHIDGFFGRRSGVYAETQDDPGLVGGATVAVDLEETTGVGLMFRGEFMHFQREITLINREQNFFEAEKRDFQLNLGEVGAFFDATDELLFSTRVSIFGAGVSHVRGGVRYAFGRSAALLDVDLKVGKDFYYDLAGGDGAASGDRNVTAEALRLNIPDLRNYVDAQLRVPLELVEFLEIEPRVGVRTVLEDEELRSPYDSDQVRWGLGLLAQFQISKRAGLELTLDYDGLTYSRSDEADEGLFADTGAGAEALSHEIAGGVRYARGNRFIGGRMLGRRNLSVGVGGFYRYYVLDNRFIDEQNETLVGGRADAKWDFSDYAGVSLAYEYARDSNVFVTSLSEFHNVRAGVHGRF